MRESALVRKIMKAVREAYPRAYVRKLSERFNRGIPDVLIVFPRKELKLVVHRVGVLFVETKIIGGTISAIQLAEMTSIENVKAHGCRVIVAITVKEVLDTLKDMGALP